ncbi:hypothetical protein PENANT_c010G11700 [Penicillium antarcticum]|uniref:Uncharacterized protein n=1 Tax=Penicillium antarcticum TaxID=416450 RepID=A0A1V6Q852_9EURO|nr:hypothetical protein PENANT_c010G11700 [Penicillium antarcticum]
MGEREMCVEEEEEVGSGDSVRLQRMHILSVAVAVASACSTQTQAFSGLPRVSKGETGPGDIAPSVSASQKHEFG